MQKVLEMVEFNLMAGATEDKFLKASEEFQNVFLKKQPGLISRNLIRMGDTWGDCAVWNSMGEAKAMEEAMQTSQCARTYNSFIEPSSIKMKLFEIVQ